MCNFLKIRLFNDLWRLPIVYALIYENKTETEIKVKSVSPPFSLYLSSYFTIKITLTSVVQGHGSLKKARQSELQLSGRADKDEE